MRGFCRMRRRRRFPSSRSSGGCVECRQSRPGQSRIELVKAFRHPHSAQSRCSRSWSVRWRTQDEQRQTFSCLSPVPLSSLEVYSGGQPCWNSRIWLSCQENPTRKPDAVTSGNPDVLEMGAGRLEGEQPLAGKQMRHLSLCPRSPRAFPDLTS